MTMKCTTSPYNGAARGAVRTGTRLHTESLNLLSNDGDYIKLKYVMYEKTVENLCSDEMTGPE